ncbi:MAG: hypothetical protein P9E88_06865 [Candidatus Competibacter sp.]|nr:hypothetical protein [Candidatus Competibacter sp.]
MYKNRRFDETALSNPERALGTGRDFAPFIGENHLAARIAPRLNAERFA